MNGKGVDDLINILIKKGLFNHGQDIVMASSPPVIGCLVKKGMQKGGSRAPQDPPGYAYGWVNVAGQLKPSGYNSFPNQVNLFASTESILNIIKANLRPNVSICKQFGLFLYW